jgi:hypothetical protein
MRTRTNRIEFHLNDKEYQRFLGFVSKSGLSVSSYLRKLIAGIIPNNAPPPEYHAMMRELFRIGNNLNQIAMVANATGYIHAERYEEVVREYRQTAETIKDAVQGGSRYRWKGD